MGQRYLESRLLQLMLERLMKRGNYFSLIASMSDEIVRCSNEQLLVMSQNYIKGGKAIFQTDFCEIQSFFGVLYLAGVKKAGHLHVNELWADDGSAPDLFVATMSKHHFQILVWALRFGQKNTRPARKAKDNIAPIRSVFEELKIVRIHSMLES